MHHAIWFYLNIILFGVLAIETGILSVLYALDCYRWCKWYTPFLVVIHLFVYMISISVFFIGLSEW